MAETVFANANVLDGEHPAQPDTTVVVEGRRIVSVGGTSIRYPMTSSSTSGARPMPGLGTGHLHAEFRHIEMGLLTHVYGEPNAGRAC